MIETFGRSWSHHNELRYAQPPSSRPSPRIEEQAEAANNLTRDSPNGLRSHILEVSAGSDVVESVSIYARRSGVGVCVLSGSGRVENVALRQSVSAAGGVVTLYGRFEMLSIMGTVAAPTDSGGPSIFLSSGPSQMVSGIVAGMLIASGPAVLMAASFSNAVYERLPLTDDQDEEEATVLLTCHLDIFITY
ncbi:hypothetical protein SAY86_011839 [Trapa natans]|uniref:PPC domain-containing protein n=1 Tax=Trapa natans TaxID=22666 RepID=A0AAN7LWA8_TRANT|nr:hypothetical protein SAY86_011839 [Trapa natans]